MRERFAELGHAEPTAEDAAAERLTGRPTARSVADDLGRFFDHLRQIGICGYVAENAGNREFLRPASTASARRPAARAPRESAQARDTSA